MNLKNQLLEIFDSALRAVTPNDALLSQLNADGGALRAGAWKYGGKGKILVAGAGKGAAPMAEALEKLLGDHIARGSVVVKYGHDLPLRHIKIIQASHPVPDEAGAKGAEECLQIAAECGPDDLLICLFTGGASSLLTLPAHGLSLEELQECTRQLLASGADIHEINAIRKHLTKIGGGQLAKAARGKVLSLIVSDVIGDDLGVIASGPTAPDESTFADCLRIIEKYNLQNSLPPAALEILNKGAAGGIAETPKPGDPFFKNVTNILIATNRHAVLAASQKAAALGLDPQILTPPLMGGADQCASDLINLAKQQKKSLKPGARPVCLLAGGETTVRISGTGKGGRNQQMALRAILDLEGTGGIGALFASTDGTDGPTDADGGFAFGDSLKKIGSRAEAEDYLKNNDSYHALQKGGELLITGPTLTNVMDLAIIIVEPQKK